ncbi:adenosylhomocysteinase [Mucilaginibacter antarcticus]|uniref:Adenosylhomocysteinase n=1 Tax=Mucilaginibacter antarcticus TaxID=1855725 RepID=A0ABW5XTJ1_9SPHI
MKRHLILYSTLIVLSACAVKKQGVTQSTKANTTVVAQADGSSYEKAIVINASGEMQGIKAEYDWLKQNYPGYTRKGQSSGSYNKRQYDMLQFTTADGNAKTIYFDITSFFGKF